MEKTLVCITPQANSRRLIDKAAEETDFSSGELHILNVLKGGSVFASEDSAELLEELFSYGANKGGIVHALAGANVPLLIKNFAKKQGITKIVVGEPPKNAPAQNTGVIEKLERNLKGVEIIVLERN